MTAKIEQWNFDLVSKHLDRQIRPFGTNWILAISPCVSIAWAVRRDVIAVLGGVSKQGWIGPDFNKLLGARRDFLLENAMTHTQTHDAVHCYASTQLEWALSSAFNAYTLHPYTQRFDRVMDGYPPKRALNWSQLDYTFDLALAAFMEGLD